MDFYLFNQFAYTQPVDSMRMSAELSRFLMLVILFLVLALAGYYIIRHFTAVLLFRLFKLRISGPSRLKVRFATVVICVYAVLLLYAFLIEPDWVRVSRTTVYTEKLRAGDELVIAQLSDLHTEAGCEIRMQRALSILKREKPDFIVLTGDYANDWRPYTQNKLHSFAGSLSSTAPTLAVLGNWDSNRTRELLEDAGVKVLENQREVIESENLSITGMDYPRHYLLSSTMGKPDGRFRVVLSHTPHMFEQAAKLGADLYLCGHTHGGQVRLPFFGTLCTAYNLIGRYQAGVYKQGQTTMYVNRGLGMEGGAPRIRFWCWPEVAVIRVRGEN